MNYHISRSQQWPGSAADRAKPSFALFAKAYRVTETATDVWAGDADRPAPWAQSLLDTTNEPIPIAYAVSDPAQVYGLSPATCGTAVICGGTDAGGMDVLVNLGYGAAIRNKTVTLVAGDELYEYAVTAFEYIDDPVTTVDLNGGDSPASSEITAEGHTLVRIPTDQGTTATDVPVFRVLAALTEHASTDANQHTVIIDSPHRLCHGDLDETAVRAIARVDEINTVVRTTAPTQLAERTCRELSTVSAYLMSMKAQAAIEWASEAFDVDTDTVAEIPEYTMLVPGDREQAHQVFPPTHGVGLN